MGVRAVFTIQYESVGGEHKMQDFDSRDRNKLLIHLANFSRPIVAVYEQATPITKTVRKDLAAFTVTKNRFAREFIKTA